MNESNCQAGERREKVRDCRKERPTGWIVEVKPLVLDPIVSFLYHPKRVSFPISVYISCPLVYKINGKITRVLLSTINQFLEITFHEYLL